MIILGILIFVHELGHFLTAKLFKMPVLEFAVGMGPKLFGIKRNDTEYNLRAIPFGGFVNIDGMDYNNPVENGFNTKKTYERFIVLFAGVFMNILFAFILILGLFVANGEEKIDYSNKVGSIEIESAAENILEKGDLILEIDNKEIQNWNDIFTVLSKKETANTCLLIERNSKQMEINVELKYLDSEKRYLLGISPNIQTVKYNIFSGSKRAAVQIKDITILIFKSLKMLILGEVNRKDVSGPIGVLKVVKTVAKSGGIISLLYFTAIISINLAIFNLLPLPALDGGRILFVILEMLKIKVNKNTEESIHRIGLIFFLILLVFITLNDVINWKRDPLDSIKNEKEIEEVMEERVITATEVEIEKNNDNIPLENKNNTENLNEEKNKEYKFEKNSGGINERYSK
ncbi:MAG: RIP metalloprotease RseP [Fusobacteria bacterium]|nr:RIP metalloprotease RseP [Fusobacteriota bacterium]